MSSAYNSPTSFCAKSERRNSSVAPIATVDFGKSDKSCFSQQHTNSLKLEPSSSNVILTETPSVTDKKFFLDDEYFQNFGLKDYQNFDEELYTFEEFLDYSDKPDLTDKIDEFDSIPLDSPKNKYFQKHKNPKGKELNYIVDSDYSESNTESKKDKNISESPTNCTITNKSNLIKPITSSSLPIADLSHIQSQEPSPFPENLGPVPLSTISEEHNMGLMKMLCCLRPQNRSSRYHAPLQVIETVEPPRPTQYSWDVNRADPKDYMFTQRTNEVMIKKAGEINGQQFVIENCKDCIVIVLDHSGAITVDDCEDCLFVFGPCSGSVFIRNSQNCFCYCISKQFRVRDSNIYVHLFSSTPPVIEESKVEFFPLHMNYDNLDDHMFKASLSPYCNSWNKVYDFTPDKQAVHFSCIDDPPETEVEDKLGLIASAYQLNFTRENSFFIQPDSHKFKDNDEIALLLFKQGCTEKNDKEFYIETKKFVDKVLKDKSILLVNIMDMNVQKGDLQSTLPAKIGLKLSGHIVILEFQGKSCRRYLNSIINEINKSNSNLKNNPFELIQSENKEKLYKFSEIKYSV